MVGKLDKMVIASAFTDNLPGRSIGAAALGATLDEDQRRHIEQAITDRGIDFVLQEAVTLSTMPVWHEGGFEPRPFILRLYLARVGDGWTVMPGGFVRIADGTDAHAVSLQKGGRTADACVLSERPVAETTLLPAPERIAIQRASGVLPSRAAYNLFWVGRYVERAEATLRLVRALINRITEADEAAVADHRAGQRDTGSLERRSQRHTEGQARPDRAKPRSPAATAKARCRGWSPAPARPRR